MSYGLGSLNENLPTFVVLPDHRGFASNGTEELGQRPSCPSQHQGTVIYPGTENPDRRSLPATSGTFITPGERSRRARPARAAEPRARRDARGRRRGSRPASAATNWPPRCSSPRPEALDISKEPAHILKLYGLDHGTRRVDKEINALEETDYFGRKCLVARRLLERGVRFVQIWSGNDNGFPRRNWDSHEDVERDHGPLALGMARGAAALIQDLKQRGLLDDTIILWTTEFGRMPCIAGRQGPRPQPVLLHQLALRRRHQGRHQPRRRATSGATSPPTASNPTEVYDIHATILHLLGIDHTRLTFRHNGIDRRLTDVHGHVIEELMA